MAIRILSALLVAGAILAAGCGGDDEVELTEVDIGSTVDVQTGDVFSVVLESNPSTGYVWRLDPGSPAAFVVLRSTVHEPASDDPDLVGGFGYDTLQFEAVAPGAEILRLEYVRSFDEPAIPDRVAEFIVEIDDVEFTRDTSDPPTTSTATAPISVSEVIAAGPGDVTVIASVFIDDSGARFCEVLMESFPPQCGEPSIPIANPDALDVALDEEQGIRWSPSPPTVSGTWDGTSFVVAAS